MGARYPFAPSGSAPELSELFCTMLLEQIKGFYHVLIKVFLLAGCYSACTHKRS